MKIRLTIREAILRDDINVSDYIRGTRAIIIIEKKSTF